MEIKNVHSPRRLKSVTFFLHTERIKMIILLTPAFVKLVILTLYFEYKPLAVYVMLQHSRKRHRYQQVL